jgi:hypothetical protein
MRIKRVFDIRKLKPFHRELEAMPKPAPEQADELSKLDHDLRPDELAYVKHYVGYADILLNELPEEEDGASASKSPQSNVIELPKMQDPESDGNGKAA